MLRCTLTGVILAVAWWLAGGLPQSAAQAPAGSGLKREQLAAQRNALLRSIEQTHKGLQTLENRVPPLKKRVEELLREINALQVAKPEAPTEDAKPSPDESGPRIVRYRPPMVRETKKKPQLVVLCEGNRVSVYNMNWQESHFKKHRLQAAIDAALKSGDTAFKGTWVLEEGSFNLDYALESLNFGAFIRRSIKQSLVRKSPGDLGESIAELKAASSAFQRALETASATGTYVQFAVYSDGFEAFRAAREIVWEKRFDVQWIPMSPGETLQFGGGSGSVQ